MFWSEGEVDARVTPPVDEEASEELFVVASLRES
jgi:hypothetical protein